MGALGQGTVVVDGQRNTAPPMSAFVPQSFGQQTTGVPNVSPIVPPYASAVSGGGAAQGFASVNGYGTAANNGLVTSIAAAHPYNLKVSPVLWAVAFLIGGVTLLQLVSWRETVEEHASIGKAHESAEAGA